MAAPVSQYQKSCFNVFSSAWSAYDSADPAKSIDSAAQSLASSCTESQDPSPSFCIWNTILALHQFATVEPTSIDFLLHIYDGFCKLLPQSVSNDYGRGEKAGRIQLRWWLIDNADIFDPSSEHIVGEPDTADKSTLKFSAKDLNFRTEDVLARMEEWRQSRTHFIISMAIMGRCLALGVWRERRGDQAEGLISVAFRRHDRWTEADFIGNCILLRGCAKTLTRDIVDGDRKIEEWGQGLRNFILENDGFGRKYHATLTLRNLVQGPKDESSKEMFELELWVF